MDRSMNTLDGAWVDISREKSEGRAAARTPLPYHKFMGISTLTTPFSRKRLTQVS